MHLVGFYCKSSNVVEDHAIGLPSKAASDARITEAKEEHSFSGLNIQGACSTVLIAFPAALYSNSRSFLLLLYFRSSL